MEWTNLFETVKGTGNKIFFFFADIFFPPSNIESMGTESFNAKVRRFSPSEDDSGIHPLFVYRDPLVRRAIWELKFRGNRKVAKMLAELLYDELVALQSEVSGGGKIVLIPIPMSEKRHKEKGFNQIEMLLDEVMQLDKGTNFSLQRDALFKIKNTPRQVTIKNRKQRLLNVVGCFAANRRKIANQTLFLIDDVTTTGATLTEAKKVLLTAGANKVYTIALAH